MKTKFLRLARSDNFSEIFINPEKIVSIDPQPKHCSKITLIGPVEYEVSGDPEDILAAINGEKLRAYSNWDEMEEEAKINGSSVSDHDNNTFDWDTAFRSFGPEELKNNFVWTLTGDPCAIDVELRIS